MTPLLIPRRAFLGGMVSAPAIVRASSLMPIRSFILPARLLYATVSFPIGSYFPTNELPQ